MIINIKVLFECCGKGVEKLETTIQIIFTFKLNLRCLLILTIHFKCKLFVNLIVNVTDLLEMKRFHYVTIEVVSERTVSFIQSLNVTEAIGKTQGIIVERISFNKMYT